MSKETNKIGLSAIFQYRALTDDLVKENVIKIIVRNTTIIQNRRNSVVLKKY